MQLLQRWCSSRVHRVLVTALALLVGPLSSCGGNDTTAPGPSLNAGNGPKGRNAPVHVTPQSDTLDALYDTLPLAANVDVTWTSLTPAIATVDASGHVVAVGPGIGLIQALGVGGLKADTAKILVRQLVASVHVTPNSLALPAGFTDTLTAVTADANGYPILDAFVTWVSDLISAATVSNGIVTGVDTGTTTIRATVDGASDSASVRVFANPYP